MARRILMNRQSSVEFEGVGRFESGSKLGKIFLLGQAWASVLLFDVSFLCGSTGDNEAEHISTILLRRSEKARWRSD